MGIEPTVVDDDDDENDHKEMHNCLVIVY